MYSEPGPFPRPGLLAAHDGAAIDVEVWDLPRRGIEALPPRVASPLLFGPIELDNGAIVTGFVGDPACADGAEDITTHGSWRSYLATPRGQRVGHGRDRASVRRQRNWSFIGATLARHNWTV